MFLFAASVFALGFSPAAADKADLDDILADIVAGEASGNPLAGAVLAVKVGDDIVYAGAAGCAEFDEQTPQRCARKLKTTTKLRVASISKMATAMGALALEREGKLDLDGDVSGMLGWPLRNPAFPDKPVTARQLMTHTSSLRDPEEYWVDAPGDFNALIAAQKPFAAKEKKGSRAPGDYFTYANINFGVLATVMEKSAGERFDQIIKTRVAAPLGLDIGFNWMGVSTKARRHGAVLYRGENGRFIAQTDGPEILRSRTPVFRRKEGVDPVAYLATYSPGANATLFSPQGGLRANILDLLAMLESRGDIAVAWRFDPKAENGDTSEGFYPAAGLGALVAKGDERRWPGAEFVGHSGEAYGLVSGVWRVSWDAALGRTQEVSFAYAITGSMKPPARGRNPSFYDIEEPLLGLAMAAAAEAGVRVDDEPRPFDETRDAMKDVDAALARAKAADKRVLLILGGDWCHDSRSFAARIEGAGLAPLIAAHYEKVFVDVGRRDRNLDVARRFGVDSLIGTPTVLILSADGELLNADTVHDWKNAASRSAEEVRRYLEAARR
jgi:CubicO group peptidase (beta-lactamase class C family)